MNIGRIALMELKTGWKAILICGLLALLLTCATPQMYPLFQEGFNTDLEGAEYVNLTLPEELPGTAVLTWQRFPLATQYTVYESNLPVMIPSNTLYSGTQNTYQFTYHGDENLYIAVAANFSGQTTLIGMATTNHTNNAFDIFLDSVGFESFTGGYDLDITEPSGFISLYAFSWWWFIVAIFVAFYAPSIITSDFETKRLDLIFSTPVPRMQYILEKFVALTIISIILVLISILGLIGGIAMIPALQSVSATDAFLAFLPAIPLLMTISAVGILLGVIIQKGKTAIGGTIGLVAFEYLLFSFSNIADALDPLKYISIFYYWDYNQVLVEGTFYTAGFLILLFTSFILTAISIYYFQTHDIPAQ